ncbi:MAG: zinc dependent phospholipase C family protein, partial [Nitrospinota bacterium]
MPKEITHWTLAEKAVRLADDRSIKEVVSNNRFLYLLGAVSPDTPYYQTSPVTTDLYEEVGRRLHGISDGGAFKPLACVARIYEEITQGALAFLLGVISHLVVDGEYHPFIYHFSGNTHNANRNEMLRASYRHRLLETYLDLHYYGDVEPANGYSVYRAYKGKEMGDREFFDLLGALYFDDRAAHRRDTVNAMLAHCFWHGCFKREWLKYTVALASKISPFASEHYAALFYPRMKPLRSPFFNGKISYKNHVTGSRHRESIKEIEEKCIKNI